MSFARTMWRLLVAVKDGLVLVFMLLFFALLYMALSANPAGTVRDGVLVLDLAGTIVEQPVEPDPFSLVSGSGPMVREYALRDVIHAIDSAAGDTRVKAIALDLDVFTGGGQVAIANVADALERAKRAGKPVIAFASAYTDDSYQLAAHASEIWLDPLGAVLFTGRGGNALFFRGLLDKLGITPHVFRVGTYKSAVEPFTRDDMSPESRAASQALAGALWEQWLEDVSRARPKARVAAFAAAPAAAVSAQGGDLAKAALAAGLVDKIADRTAFGDRLAQLAGRDDENVPGSFRAITYDAWVAAKPIAHEATGTIGVLTVAGNIVGGTAGPGTAASGTIAEQLAKGMAERNLSALVVRIDSPGGSAPASEDIRQSILDAKAKGLPVVVSMGSVAASGGYWIATAGDHIFAEPSTITGSIGVFGIFPSVGGTLAKLGITVDGVGTTPLSREPNFISGPSPEASQLIQFSIEGIYRRFISIVAGARKMSPERVNQVAQGRVWDGGTARQLGLVDSFGSLDAAIAEAGRRAGLAKGEAKAVYLDGEESLRGMLLRALGGGQTASAPGDAYARLGERPHWMLARALTDLKLMVEGSALQMRCLDCPVAATPPQTSVREVSWLERLLRG